MDQQNARHRQPEHRHRLSLVRLAATLGVLGIAGWVAMLVLIVNTRATVDGVKDGVKTNRQETLTNRSNGIENRTVLCAIVRRDIPELYRTLSQCQGLDVPTVKPSTPPPSTRPPAEPKPSDQPAPSTGASDGMSGPD